MQYYKYVFNIVARATLDTRRDHSEFGATSRSIPDMLKAKCR